MKKPTINLNNITGRDENGNIFYALPGCTRTYDIKAAKVAVLKINMLLAGGYKDKNRRKY